MFIFLYKMKPNIITNTISHYYIILIKILYIDKAMLLKSD